MFNLPNIKHRAPSQYKQYLSTTKCTLSFIFLLGFWGVEPPTQFILMDLQQKKNTKNTNTWRDTTTLIHMKHCYHQLLVLHMLQCSNALLIIHQHIHSNYTIVVAQQFLRCPHTHATLLLQPTCCYSFKSSQRCCITLQLVLHRHTHTNYI